MYYISKCSSSYPISQSCASSVIHNIVQIQVKSFSDFSEFKRVIYFVFGARQADFWDCDTQQTKSICTKWSKKTNKTKQNASSERQLIGAGGQRRMAELL